VREKRGLTYGISTSLTAYRKASVMVGSVASRADAIGQTVQVVKQTLADFAAEGPTQAELDDAKTYLTGSFPLAFASNAGISAQLGVFQRQDLDIGYIARRNSLILAVTLADVKRVAKRLFDPARLTVVVAGSAAGGGAPQTPKPPVRPTPQPAAPPPQAAAQSPATGTTPKPVDKLVIKTPIKPSP
jgi:zinc protease